VRNKRRFSPIYTHHQEPSFSAVPQVLVPLLLSTSIAFPGPAADLVATTFAERSSFKAHITPGLSKSFPLGIKIPDEKYRN